MKELIRFGLKRRCFNKTFLVSQILLVVLLGCVLNLDKIAHFFGFSSAGLLPLSYGEVITQERQDQAGMFGFVLTKDAELRVIETNTGFSVSGSRSLDTIARMKLQAYLTSIHQNAFLAQRHPNVTELIMEYENVEIDYQGEMSKPIGRENFVFMILTAVYFMVLNFAATTSNEVVGEKSANVLDMVLSATDVKSHYFAKLIGGWLTMAIQGTFTLGVFAFFTYFRNQEDLGRGLLSWLSQFGLVERDVLSFRMLIAKLELDVSFSFTILLCVFFLFCGMALIQILMTIFASKMKSAEEASILQGPVYIFLLILYYVALSQNTASRLSSGFGKVASLSPITSMLFMPMRLLSSNVSAQEIVLGFLVVSITLVIVISIGQRLYADSVRQSQPLRKLLVKNQTK